jgi:hypothetical protein
MEKLPSGRRRTEFWAEWWPGRASWQQRMEQQWWGRSVARERERREEKREREKGGRKGCAAV